jgi:hypothetical protein
MVAARQYKDRFAAYLQPPPPGSPNPPAQPNGAPWPAQVGVACSSGLEFTTHSVRAVLDENPTWVDVALDAKNAFNSIHRRTFLKVIGDQAFGTGCGQTTESPPSSTFGASTSRRRSSAAARAQDKAVPSEPNSLPILCLVQSLIGHRGMLIAYCDDIHILCPPSVANEILLLLGPPPPLPPPRPHSNPPSSTPPSSPRASSSDRANSPSMAPPYLTRSPARA